MITLFSAPHERSARHATIHRSELIAVRREKLAKLRELGIDPFGGKFDTTTTPGKLKANFADDQPVTIAGRLLAIRDMGKSVFATIGDVEGRIQIYLNKKGVSETDWQAYQLLDMGDWIGVQGETFTTGKGEPSVKVEKLTVLSKSLRPMQTNGTVSPTAKPSTANVTSTSCPTRPVPKFSFSAHR